MLLIRCQGQMGDTLASFSKLQINKNGSFMGESKPKFLEECIASIFIFKLHYYSIITIV
jgi:hypothetical protein